MDYCFTENASSFVSSEARVYLLNAASNSFLRGLVDCTENDFHFKNRCIKPPIGMSLPIGTRNYLDQFK
jgi:hypothetical protein